MYQLLTPIDVLLPCRETCNTVRPPSRACHRQAGRKRVESGDQADHQGSVQGPNGNRGTYMALRLGRRLEQTLAQLSRYPIKHPLSQLPVRLSLRRGVNLSYCSKWSFAVSDTLVV